MVGGEQTGKNRQKETVYRDIDGHRRQAIKRETKKKGIQGRDKEGRKDDNYRETKRGKGVVI